MAEIKIIRALGSDIRLEVTVTDEKDHVALHKALFYTEPNICAHCKSTDITWSSRKVKGQTKTGTFIYISRRCRGCGWQSDAGQYTDGGGFFWKPWHLYERDDREPRNG